MRKRLRLQRISLGPEILLSPPICYADGQVGPVGIVCMRIRIRDDRRPALRWRVEPGQSARFTAIQPASHRLAIHRGRLEGLPQCLPATGSINVILSILGSRFSNWVWPYVKQGAQSLLHPRTKTVGEGPDHLRASQQRDLFRH